MQESTSTRKLFIGGLSINTTKQSMQTYFSQFGLVEDCVLMHNKYTGKSRWFGFVIMKRQADTRRILDFSNHNLDGKNVDCKYAVPPESPTLYSPPKHKSRRIFVGGLPYEITEDDFFEHFSKFGKVEESSIMIEKLTGKSRGFGFITYEEYDSVEQVLDNYDFNYINGKWVEVKLATPKEPSTNASSPELNQVQDPEELMESRLQSQIEVMLAGLLEDEEEDYLENRTRRTTI